MALLTAAAPPLVASAGVFGAMNLLGLGLSEAGHHEDALSVKEAELSMLRRLGAPEEHLLFTQSNLAATYARLGRLEEAFRLNRDVYSGRLKLNGEEHAQTLIEASNYATSLFELERFEEAKSLWRKVMPVSRRVLGENHDITLRMRFGYAVALLADPTATLDDLREAVTTLEEIDRIAQRVLGGAHPLTGGIEKSLQNARATLRSREAPGGGA